MEKATIAIKEIHPARPGNKLASVKDDQGRYWKVWPDKLHKFVPGNYYDIEYETWTGNTGATNRTIKVATLIGPGPTPAPAATGHVRTNGNGGNGQSSEKDEDIAVLALAKPLLDKLNNPTSASVLACLNSVRDAWREHKASFVHE